MESDSALGRSVPPEGESAAAAESEVEAAPAADREDAAWPVLSTLELGVCLGTDPQEPARGRADQGMSR